MNLRLPAIDELRGLAVLVVMFAHGSAFTPFGDFIPLRFAELTTASEGREHDSIVGAIEFHPEPEFTQQVSIDGWAVDTASDRASAISGVRVWVNGQSVGPVRLGLPQPVVADRFGPPLLSSGWTVVWEVANTPPGHYLIEMEATSEAGATARFQRQAEFARAAQWPRDARWSIIAAEIAVDLFFIISGFLITQILVTSHRQPGALPAFYLRRAMRILPLALLVIALSWALFPSTRHLWPAYVFFANNYVVGAHGVMHGLGVMWSLAIEEQFYLVFPILCGLAPRPGIWLLVGGLTLAPFGASLAGDRQIVDSLYPADIRTHAHAHVIGLGSWLALLRLNLVPRPWLTTLALSTAMAALAVLFPRAFTVLEAPALLILPIVVWLAASGSFPSRLPWLRYLGVRCYGLYLIHTFVAIAAFALLPHLSWLPRGARFSQLVVFLAGTIVLAILSFRYFEQPIMRLAPRRGPGIPTATAEPSAVVSASRA